MRESFRRIQLSGKLREERERAGHMNVVCPEAMGSGSLFSYVSLKVS